MKWSKAEGVNDRSLLRSKANRARCCPNDLYVLVVAVTKVQVEANREIVKVSREKYCARNASLDRKGGFEVF